MPFSRRHCGEEGEQNRQSSSGNGMISEPHLISMHHQPLAHSASRTSKLVEHLHSVFVSTYPVLFLGTPHAGSSRAGLAATIRRLIDAVVPSRTWDTDGQLVEALREGSETLQFITDMFVPLMKNFGVYFPFLESKKRRILVPPKTV
jgi:hypothetical protein